jgi:hypothetical protein
MMKPWIRRHLPLLPVLTLVAMASNSLLEGYTTAGVTWGTSTVQYYVNPRNVHVSESAAISAIQTAAAAWHDQTRANIQLSYAGYTSGSSVGLNYKNEVFFRGGTTGGNVAEGYYWYDGSGKIVDGDIMFFEGAYKFFAFSGCLDGVYIENVGVHEFGHVLGILHTDVPAATMAPAMQSYCDTTWETLESDDITAVEAMYRPLSGGTNTAPSVAVTSPGSSASYLEGTSITFMGSATDSQDGNLSGSLRWTSSLAGLIGTGGSFSRTLSAGTHVISATATDSGGLSASQQVSVTVTASAQPPTPSGVGLTARGYKVKGLQKVDLTWSGLTSETVDVYRNDARIGTITNDGAMTDPVNKKGPGAYAYKVCAAGTSTCSNQASVTF